MGYPGISESSMRGCPFGIPDLVQNLLISNSLDQKTDNKKSEILMELCKIFLPQPYMYLSNVCFQCYLPKPSECSHKHEKIINHCTYRNQKTEHIHNVTYANSVKDLWRNDCVKFLRPI